MEPRPRSHGNATLAPFSMSSPKLHAAKRPNTTPKLRIQKLLSLPHKEATECLSTEACEVFFMTNLPDSPPKLDREESLCITRPSSAESAEDIAPAPDEINPENNSNSIELNTQSDTLTQIDTLPSIDQAPTSNIVTQEPQDPSDGLNADYPETNDGESSNQDQRLDSHYAQWMQQMQIIEASRAQLIHDLNGYVEALHNKSDEAGECLVTFPDNYDDVLALMTGKDVQDSAGSNWSKALLKDGLIRTQAFGIIDGEDNPTELNMKIARGIAQIRKNDIILDTLNKKLKSSGPLAKSIPIENTSTPALPKKTRSNSAQRIKEKVEAAKSIDASSVSSAPARGGIDFITKNKEMKLAGKNLTQAEEARALALLDDTNDNPELAPAVIVDKAYKPLPDEQERIQSLDTELKAGKTLLLLLNLLQEMLELRRENSVATLSESFDIPSSWKDSAERYKQERLNAIDATLQAFRDEDNGIGLVGDDDCISFSSGYSRRTSISGVSTTSSRIVSKRQLQEISTKAKEEVTEKAPAAAIQQLLASLSGISIEIIDDEIADDDNVSVVSDTSDIVQPHKPQENPSRNINCRRRRSEENESKKKAPTVSSFAHLFTLPFESQTQPPRKAISVTTRYHR